MFTIYQLVIRISLAHPQFFTDQNMVKPHWVARVAMPEELGMERPKRLSFEALKPGGLGPVKSLYRDVYLAAN